VKKFKIKSYCKVNLYLKVGRKLNNGYHNIASLISFCDIYDLITISQIKGLKDKITFSGKFKKGINLKKNTVTRLFYLLRKKKLLVNTVFKINIKKNIPHSSGLGGGSSNAADLLNFLNKKKNLELNKKDTFKLANKIGFDTPICLEKKNTFLNGKKNKISRFNKKLNLFLIIIYPNISCSTKKIYEKNKKISLTNVSSFPNFSSRKKLIFFLKDESNDLEKAVIKIYPKIGKIIRKIKSFKGCHFSRVTGTGSACIGIFSNEKNAKYAKKMIKLKYPKYWCVASKTV